MATAQIEYWTTIPTAPREKGASLLPPGLHPFHHWRCGCGVGGHGFDTVSEALLDAGLHLSTAHAAQIP